MCFVPLFAASLPAEQPSGNSNDFDHLIPVEGILEPAYERLLGKRLFRGSRDMIRIIAMPSSASGESGIAIQDRNDRSEDVFVTWTKAKKNLWSAAVDNNNKIVRDPAIRTTRLEASLPRSAAIAIIEAMKRALQRTRPPTKTERVILDGTLFEISVSAPEKGGTTRGLLNDNAYGKNITALRRMIQLLEAYCHAKPAQRSELVRELETVAKGI
jgi:hypothetical protein